MSDDDFIKIIEAKNRFLSGYIAGHSNEKLASGDAWFLASLLDEYFGANFIACGYIIYYLLLIYFNTAFYRTYVMCVHASNKEYDFNLRFATFLFYLYQVLWGFVGFWNLHLLVTFHRTLLCEHFSCGSILSMFSYSHFSSDFPFLHFCIGHFIGFFAWLIAYLIFLITCSTIFSIKYKIYFYPYVRKLHNFFLVLCFIITPKLGSFFYIFIYTFFFELPLLFQLCLLIFITAAFFLSFSKK